MVNVVLNIDDVGMLHSVNTAALEIIGRGVVRSVSVFAPAPWTVEFIRELVARQLDADVGVHLALTSEWAGCRMRPMLGEVVPSLVDDQGYLHASVEALAASADTDEARRELLAQVAHVRRLGVTPTHLDAHMLFYEGSDRLRSALLDVAAGLDLPVLLYCEESIAAARARGVRSPDFGTLDNYWFANGELRGGYDRLSRRLPRSGTSVLALHPAARSRELEACMGDREAAHRAEEHELFCAGAFPLPDEVQVRSPRDVWGAR